MIRIRILIVLGMILWAIDGWAAPVYPPDEAWPGTISAPALARPAYRQTVVDPVTGANITRISGNEMNPSQALYLQHSYSKDQPWNADMTLIKLVGSVYILNANDYTIFKQWNFHNDSRWSTVDPNILFYTTGNQFRKVNVRTNADTLIRSFSQGNIALGPNEGNISIGDGRVVFVVGQTAIVYDISTNTELASKNIGSAGSDWTSISPSGNYVAVCSNTGGGVHVYDLNLNFVRTLYSACEHGDLGYHLAEIESLAQVCPNRHARLDTAASTSVSPSGCNAHISTRNYRRHGWAYLNQFGMVYAKRLDGTNIVERFAHHRSSESSYDSQAKAVASPDGSKVMWNSDWGSGTVYAYVAEMPGNGGDGGDPTPPAPPSGLRVQ